MRLDIPLGFFARKIDKKNIPGTVSYQEHFSMKAHGVDSGIDPVKQRSVTSMQGIPGNDHSVSPCRIYLLRLPVNGRSIDAVDMTGKLKQACYIHWRGSLLKIVFSLRRYVQTPDR